MLAKLVAKLRQERLQERYRALKNRHHLGTADRAFLDFPRFIGKSTKLKQQNILIVSCFSSRYSLI